MTMIREEGDNARWRREACENASLAAGGLRYAAELEERIVALDAENKRRLVRIIHLEAALRRISLIDYPEAALPRDIARAALEPAP